MAYLEGNKSKRICTRSVSQKLKAEERTVKKETSINDFLDVRDIILDKPLPQELETKEGTPFVTSVKTRERFDHDLDEIQVDPYDDLIKRPEWTVKEKRQLINGIKKYGFFDYKKIQTLLPHKKESEIRQFIHATGKKVSKDAEKDEATKGLVSCLPGWVKVMGMTFEQKYKKDDFSVALSEVMDHIAQEKFPSPQQEEGTPDYAAIYCYLREILAGRLPPQLPDLENWTLTQALDLALEIPSHISIPQDLLDRIKEIGEKPSIVEPTPARMSSREQAITQLGWLNPFNIPETHLEDLREQLYVFMECDQLDTSTS